MTNCSRSLLKTAKECGRIEEGQRYLFSHGHTSWGDDDVSTADALVQRWQQVVRAANTSRTCPHHRAQLNPKLYQLGMNARKSKSESFTLYESKCSYLSPTIPRLMVGYPCSWMVDNSVDLLESLIFPGWRSSSGFRSCTCTNSSSF